MPTETHWLEHGISDAEHTIRRNQQARTFVNQVDTMNFFDEAECLKLRKMMISPRNDLFIPLGRDTTSSIAYQFAPDWCGWVSPPYVAPEPYLPGRVNPVGMLGVNILDIEASVQPSSHSSCEPTKTEESISSTPAFISQKLGMLEYREDDEMPATMEEMEDELWDQTGYVVVAQINDEGHIGGLCVVFDKYPDIDDGCGIPYKNPRKVAGHCGTMPPAEVQMSCARIGSRLGEMNFDAKVEWTEVVNRHIEFKHLVRLENGRLERIPGSKRSSL